MKDEIHENRETQRQEQKAEQFTVAGNLRNDRAAVDDSPNISQTAIDWLPIPRNRSCDGCNYVRRGIGWKKIARVEQRGECIWRNIALLYRYLPLRHRLFDECFFQIRKMLVDEPKQLLGEVIHLFVIDR